MTSSKQRLQLTSGAADSSERRSYKQPCKRDGANVCFTSLQERWEEWGLVFFLPPPSIHRNPEAAESRLSPRWGIHKVQQMKTKCFQLPLVAENGSDLYWGGGTIDRVFSWSCSSCPLRAAETFPAVSFIICGTNQHTGKPDPVKYSTAS